MIVILKKISYRLLKMDNDIKFIEIKKDLIILLLKEENKIKLNNYILQINTILEEFGKN